MRTEQKFTRGYLSYAANKTVKAVTERTQIQILLSRELEGSKLR
jgi:hypothetical protein